MPHSKYIVAANWKMNKLASQAKPFVSEILMSYIRKNADLVICPPYTHLPHLSANKIISGFYLGAQNISEFESGAYTGEISADMLLDVGCTHVIIGHSERRAMNPFENSMIPNKISFALSKGLKVIYCCGEPLENRINGNEKSYVHDQLTHDLYHLSDLSQLIVAYEPIWAIGTGKTATSDQAEEMHLFIRKTLQSKFDKRSENLKILYGGSVKANNSIELCSKENIDGVLVGGASLIVDEFIGIVNSFNQ
ncbi:MAG: triose-phosphate isomerase [Saprospiraceae bacterium]|nr:triose-phosphate isomerase [Saprospiraceae bacterium]MBK9995325.1 triose-phosphate isomerase [Saprospiraceae bacterium]